MKATPDIEKIIDALAHLIGGNGHMSHPGAPRRFDRIHCVDSTIYDGFEPFEFGEEIERLLRAKNIGDIPFWPMDARFALHGKDEFGPFWEFNRISTLKPSEMRGRLRIVVPRMYKVELMHVSVTGGALSMIGLFGIVNGQLVDASNGLHYSRNPRWEANVKYAHGVALRNYYNWSVLLADGDGPRARFLTDPIGVREAFRLRDIPPGKRRRAALRHWVRCHWRQKRNLGAADKAWIEAYLRGATDFAWNGLRCRIEPSVSDQQKARLTA